MIILSRGSLGQTGRFKPDTFSLNLAERGSTATLTIQKIFAPDLIVGDWLQDDTDPGNGIVWRVKTIDTQYNTGIMTIQLEDLINSLNDTLLNGEVKPSDIAGAGATTCTARQAVEYILARQANWVLGSFDYGSVSNPYNFNGDSLKAALDTVSSSLEDPVWSYDFSTHPFTLNITRESSAVACEMRMDRNISTMRVTVDKSRMYTRFYPIGKKNLRLDMPGYVQKNVETWGVIEKTETDESKDTKEKLLAWANERLNVHAEPMVTVTIGGLDLSEQTGEDLDNLKMSRKCRVPLPRYSTTITEKITKLAWRDKLAEPRNVTVTMANQQEDIASIINRMNKSSGSGGRAKAKDEEEDHAWMVDTTDHIGLVAEAVAGEGADVDWSIVASVMVDGKGVHQRVTETEGELVTAFSAIEATSTNIYLQVGSARSDLTSYIEQTKSSIMSSVDDSVNDLHSEVMETQSMIRSAVWTANSTIYTYINQTASYIMNHVGARSGSKVIPGMDEPQDTPDNPLTTGDIWVEGSLINIWDDTDLIPWIDYDPSAIEYDWEQLSGQKVHVWKDGKWNLVNDGTSYAEYTDLVQTKDRVALIARNLEQADGEVQRNLARLEVQADSITSTVQKNSRGLGELSSTVEQTASQIRTEVANTASGLRSQIIQQADRISLVVEGTGSDAKVNTASIVAGVNSQSGSYVKIQANKINLTGYVTASQLNAAQASIDNLKSGAATAVHLKTTSFSIISGSAFTYGGSTIAKRSIDIGGTTYKLLVWI